MEEEHYRLLWNLKVLLSSYFTLSNVLDSTLNLGRFQKQRPRSDQKEILDLLSLHLFSESVATSLTPLDLYRSGQETQHLILLR